MKTLNLIYYKAIAAAKILLVITFIILSLYMLICVAFNKGYCDFFGHHGHTANECPYEGVKG
jgi:hypothetical protein